MGAKEAAKTNERKLAKNGTIEPQMPRNRSMYRHGILL